MDRDTQLVNFERLEADAAAMHEQFAGARPFRHVVIDDFADGDRLIELVAEMPDPHDAGIGKSRDYVFAKNKFEKSGFAEFGPQSRELYTELCSDRFGALLRAITGEDVFVDPAFHGGGMHQAGEESFLDMHVDFNKHPLHETWFRNLNILLYLNPGWESSWRGALDLRNKDTGEEASIDPLFNRCVIMETREFSLHGFAPIAFPVGVYRRSIACYAYTEMAEDFDYRSTVWYPDEGGVWKRALGRAWPTLVKTKNRFLGSGTAKNQ
ncbi:MAG: 2OG-Fe(II) oxygenase [Acidimicrobiia bacterium]